MHFPLRLTLPLMSQPGEGALADETDESNFSCAPAGTLTAPKDLCLLVPVAPIPRRDKCAGPQTGLGFTCFRLITCIIMGGSDKRHSPSVSHPPSLNVLALGLTFCQPAAEAIFGGATAGPGDLSSMSN